MLLAYVARSANRLEDASISGASADVAADGLANLHVIWGWIPIEEVMYRNDQAGRAETALHSARIDERALNVGGLAIGRQSFHGHDLRIDGGRGHDEACAHRFAIHENRARTAFTLFAGPLGARKTQSLAQDVQQAFANPSILHLMLHSIDGEFEELVSLLPCRSHRESPPVVLDVMARSNSRSASTATA